MRARRSYNPDRDKSTDNRARSVWAGPLSLATTQGVEIFFPFLRLLRCFTSPACLYPSYVFRRKYARITTRGFPHSEIRGSKVDQHLTAAYRSRPRPSSAPDAKASTACPSYLDMKDTPTLPLCSFQGTHPGCPEHRTEGTSQNDAPSKLSSMPHEHPARIERFTNP